MPYTPHPLRFQLSRKKGYRKPEGGVVVAPPTKWGNPWMVSKVRASGLFADDSIEDVCVAEFRGWLERGDSPEFDIWVQLRGRRRRILESLAELRGKQLGCWCPLDKPCHADVLCELANASP
mgnify:CR=1 FL=1